VGATAGAAVGSAAGGAVAGAAAAVVVGAVGEAVGAGNCWHAAMCVTVPLRPEPFVRSRINPPV